jgi:anti-sigma factor RsiW
MISCREVVELLCDFVEGELSIEYRLLVEQHLCGCQRCVIYVETYRLTIKLSRQLPCPPLPPQVAQRVQALLKAAGKPCADSDPDQREV